MPAFLIAEPQRRIAITGVGLVTPLGVGREQTWQGLVSGTRAVRWLESPAPDKLLNTSHQEPRLFGAKVPLEVPGQDRLVTFARLAAREAVAHARLTPNALREAACVVGTSKIDLQHVDSWIDPGSPEEEGIPFSHVLFPSRAASAVAADLGCEGGAHCPVAACATGLLSIIQAVNLIRSGECRIAVGGAADSSLHRGVLASYRRLGVLARPGTDPGTCCRPFDAERNGFAVGEGAGVLILEDWEFAESRRAPILAEWEDGAISSDSNDLIRTDRNGPGLQRLIQHLFHRQRIGPDDISAVSLHGTGTLLNDLSEGTALQRVFAARRHPVSAFGLKGAIGHLMGAAGAVEAAACILGLARQQFLPTVNHLNRGEDLAHLPIILNTRSSEPFHRTLKISLGFGGTLAAALIKAVS